MTSPKPPPDVTVTLEHSVALARCSRCSGLTPRPEPLGAVLSWCTCDRPGGGLGAQRLLAPARLR